MIFIRIFRFNFEIRSTAKILSNKSDSAIISGKLNSEISILWIHIMRNHWCILFKPLKYLWFIEILNLDLRFEKDNNRLLFTSFLINIVDYFFMYLCNQTIFEINFPVWFWINWWLLIHFLNSERCIKNLHLTTTHASKGSCYTKNRTKIGRQFWIRESCCNKVDKNLFFQASFFNFFSDTAFMKIGPYCSVAVMNFIWLTISLLVIDSLVDSIDIIWIIFISLQVSYHCMSLIFHDLFEDFAIYLLTYFFKLLHLNNFIWL